MKRTASALIEVLLLGVLLRRRPWLKIPHRNHPQKLHRWQRRVRKLRRHRSPPHLSIGVATYTPVITRRSRPKRVRLRNRVQLRPANHPQWPQAANKGGREIRPLYRAQHEEPAYPIAFRLERRADRSTEYCSLPEIMNTSF
jgi:hypothetical protein